MTKQLILALLALTLCSPASQATQDNATEYQIKLDQIREKITNVLSRLNKNQSKRNDVRDELQKLERKIAKISKNLRDLRRKHKKSTFTLKSLKRDLKKLKIRLINQRQLLSGQIRSAHAMGQQAQIKLMLNQQEPATLGRTMIYYDYLNRARTTEINTYLQSIERKLKLETSISRTQNELEQLVNKQLSQKKQLSSHRGSRKQLLAKLEQDINSQQETLTELKGSRHRIEELLMSLGELLADIPNAPVTQKPFAKLKGKLPWPVRGKFTAKFGTSRNQGDLNWNGVVINTAYGTPVRAISHGRVAFSDWLQGFGFITIIDHNDGYMSLYGHNQELHKLAGDWVEASEVIASVGDSGGQSSSGLYFEMRYQGKPINPDTWCSMKIRHLAQAKQ